MTERVRIKLKIHSVVDVITNSSTVIYTNQGFSVEPAKEMINEFLKVFGVEGTWEDYFYIDAFADTYFYEYNAKIEGFDGFSTREAKNNFLKDTFNKVLRREIERPLWMKQAEGAYSQYGDDFSSVSDDVELVIEAKDSKYNDLADKIKRFLNSPTTDATYDG